METYLRGVLAYGVEPACLARLSEIGSAVQLDVYEITDEVDLVAIPSLIVLINSDKLTASGYSLLNDYYVDAGEAVEELVVWFGSRPFQGKVWKQEVCPDVETALKAIERYAKSMTAGDLR